MSNGTLEQVLIRIKGATPASQIAVFRCDEPDKLNAVFAATVTTTQLIDSGHAALIGVYDGTMNLDDVQQELRGRARLSERAAMKVRFYVDLWPGLDPARTPLTAFSSPMSKPPGTVRVAFDVAIPDAILFCVDAVSPEVGKVEIVEDHVDG